MDVSEGYIKMCKKAEEIQKDWQPSVGDWFLHDYHGTTSLGKELEDKVWIEKEQWERIECLTYKPSIGDYIEVSMADGSHGVYTSSSLLKDRHIWLPRQDQLQEMVFTYIAGTYNLLPTKVLAFSDYWEKNGFPLWATSLEQLWLAFVMKQKFGEVWDGRDWTKG